MTPRPALPLPPPITGERPGTWAHDTITRRLPEIARRTLDGNAFAADVAARLEALIAEIPHAPIRRIGEGFADSAMWNDLLAPYLGQNWLTIPWLVAEFYFYRRLLEATGYHATGLDPFEPEKAAGLHESRAAVDALAEKLASRLDQQDPAPALRELLERSLWGNQADLSLWPTGGDAAGAHETEGDRAAHTLVDDLDSAVAALRARAGAVVLLADNAGFEFVSDLALVDFLITGGLASHVDLHLKPHPMFVSDAMLRDLTATIGFLTASSERETRAMGERLTDALERGTLRPSAFLFWALPVATWQLPTTLRDSLGSATLVISKGDLHYRRLLGDREWPYTTPFDRIVSYMPAPLLALRTLKSELAAGLDETAISRASRQDPRWLTDGRWAVAQMSYS